MSVKNNNNNDDNNNHNTNDNDTTYNRQRCQLITISSGEGCSRAKVPRVEVPKAPMESRRQMCRRGGKRQWCPLPFPSPIGDLGQRDKLPQSGPGQSFSHKRILANF